MPLPSCQRKQATGNMPTVLRWRGYRFHFFCNEGNEPPHIHISKDDSEAKYLLEDCALAFNFGFKHNEIRQLERMVEDTQEFFLEKWYECHD